MSNCITLVEVLTDNVRIPHGPEDASAAPGWAWVAIHHTNHDASTRHIFDWEVSVAAW